MMAPMSNQPHMNPGVLPLQQPSSAHLGLSGESLENHLGSYSNLAGMGSTNNLHALDMTSRLDSIVPKVELGLQLLLEVQG